MNHPITPPLELVQQWSGAALGAKHWLGGYDLELIATQAARWGADTELEACVEWMQAGFGDVGDFSKKLRAARRPKPPSLAEEALQELERTIVLLMPVTGPNKVKRFATIRAALERLQELEKGDE